MLHCGAGTRQTEVEMRSERTMLWLSNLASLNATNLSCTHSDCLAVCISISSEQDCVGSCGNLLCEVLHPYAVAMMVKLATPRR